MRPLVSLLFPLLLAGSPAAATFEIAAPLENGPAAYSKRAARIATDGETFLTVWVDSRPSGPAPRRQLRGMLLDRHGVPMSDQDFAITGLVEIGRCSGDRECVEVASAGNGYVVGYSDASSTRFVHVSPDGKVEAAKQTVRERLRALVALPGGYVAALEDDSRESDLLLLDQQGHVSIPYQCPVGRSCELWNAALFATADGRVLVTYDDRVGRQIVFLTAAEFRSLNGALLEPVETIRDAAPEVAIAESTGRFLLVSSDRDEVTMWLLDRNGQLVRTVRREIPELATSSDSLRVAALGSGFVLAAARVDPDALSLQRLDAELEPIAPFERLTYAADDVSLIPLSDGGVALAYANGGIGATRVQRLTPSGKSGADTPPDGTVVSLSAPSQEDGAVRLCGDVYTTAWIERRSDRSFVRVRRFDSHGLPLGAPETIRIVETAGVADLELTCGRDSVLLTWWDTAWYERRLAFLPRDGAATHASLRGAEGAAIFDGQHFFTLSSRFFELPLLTQWSESGEMKVQTPIAALEGKGLWNRELSWTGRDFYVAWHEEAEVRGRLMARRFDRNANPVGPELALAPESLYVHYLDPVIEARPEGAIVAWMNTAQPFAFTARIDPDDVLLDPLGGAIRGGRMASDSAFNLTLPLQISWNGSAFELMTGTTVTLLSMDGGNAEYPLAPDADAHVEAMTESGNRRLVLHWRMDPVTGMRRLFGEFADATAWKTPVARRRSARH